MSTALVPRAPDEPGPARRSGLRKVLQLLIALPVAAAIGWYGHEWFTVGRFLISTNDAQVGGEVVVIAPKISGVIARVLVTDNQPVRAGDLLISLDDHTYRAALTQAEVRVTEQQSTLQYLDGMRRLQESSGGAGPGDSQQTVLETQKRQTTVALDKAIADRDAARVNLGYTELRAPTDGVVDTRGVRVGALAEVGSPLVAVLPPQLLWVDATFDEKQTARIHPGQAATIQAARLPDEVFHGQVIGPSPTAVGRGTVRIALDRNASRPGLLAPGLRPGLRVTAEVDTRDPK